MSGYTEAKVFGIADGESVATDPCPGGELGTWRVPAGVYNFTWGAGNQRMVIVMPCSSVTLVFEAGKAGSIDILMDNVHVTADIACLVQLRPESYETLLSANSFATGDLKAVAYAKRHISSSRAMVFNSATGSLV